MSNMIKKPSRQMCIDYIRQLVTTENFAQLCYMIDHMPKEIAEEMKHTTRPVGIIPPLHGEPQRTIKSDAAETEAWIRNRRR